LKRNIFEKNKNGRYKFMTWALKIRPILSPKYFDTKEKRKKKKKLTQKGYKRKDLPPKAEALKLVK